MRSLGVAWVAGILALAPVARNSAADKPGTDPSNETFDRLFAQAGNLKLEQPQEGFSPLYANVTNEIAPRIYGEVSNIQDAGRGPGFIGLPTAGRSCLTTAPNCGRPTLVGCNPKVTTGRKCRPTTNGCNQTTAITCGCRPTQGNCPPPPPPTTAPNCGNRPTLAGCPPPTTAPNCGQPPGPQPGPGPLTTAPNCR